MSEVWVLNASPLILFARVNGLEIIERIASSIVIPEAVIDEVRAGAADDSFAHFALAFAQNRRASNLPISASPSSSVRDESGLF